MSPDPAHSVSAAPASELLEELIRRARQGELSEQAVRHVTPELAELLLAAGGASPGVGQMRPYPHDGLPVRRAASSTDWKSVVPVSRQVDSHLPQAPHSTDAAQAPEPESEPHDSPRSRSAISAQGEPADDAVTIAEPRGELSPAGSQRRSPANADDAAAGSAPPDNISEAATLLPGNTELAYTTDCDEPSAAPALNAAFPRQFGEYELLREIARGGMGVVYLAKQRRLNRTVALKMILTGRLANSQEVQRFYAEAEAAAGLDHPGIVPVYEMGEQDGHHFFSMGFVDGESLQARLQRGPLESREAARLLHQVTEAIAYAHAQGVLHRDLKPANILCGRAGEVVVTDFGLAKQLDVHDGLTATGQILGTPGYLPPEQAHGKRELVGPRADIYSLGAMLYSMLTGRPPFQSATVVDTLTDVLEKDPLPPRLLNRGVDRDLELICLKCLEKSPERRYHSATELCRELERYLEGEAISISGFRLVDVVARTLGRSKYDVEFKSWSMILIWFALVIVLAEAAMFAIGASGYFDHTRAVSIRIAQFALLGGILWAYRNSWWRNQGAIERQMLSIWAGFAISCHLVVAVNLLMIPDAPYDYFLCYPAFAIISGFMFFVFGGSHWGVCYLFGGLFFAAAVLMAVYLVISPLLFGALWAFSLGMLGFRLRQL